MTTSSQESRYCRCLVHVSKQYPRYNPYAVCTKSVGRPRGKVTTCMDKLRYEDFKTEELRGYAMMKKFPQAAHLSREALIKQLYGYVAATKGKKVWSEYVKDIRKAYPNMNYRDLVRLASKDYRKEKSEFLSGV